MAKRVSEEVTAGVKDKGRPMTEKEELGGTVGYKIRFEDMTTEMTKISYLTDGGRLSTCRPIFSAQFFFDF